MSRDVLVRIPEGMYKEIERFVKRGWYRSVGDFFYIAGQKELGRVQWVEIGREDDAEDVSR